MVLAPELFEHLQGTSRVPRADPVQELPGLDVGGAGHVVTHELLRDVAAVTRKGTQGVELGVQERRVRTHPVGELQGRRMVELEALGRGPLLQIARQVPLRNGSTVDHGTVPHLGDGLVEATALLEALRVEQEHAVRVGVGEVGDDGLRGLFGELVGLVDDDQAEAVTDGQGVEGDGDVGGLDVGCGLPLVEVEGLEALLQTLLEALDGGLALELV